MYIHNDGFLHAHAYSMELEGIIHWGFFKELLFSFHNFLLEESEILMILILKLIKTVWTAEA